MSEDDCKAPKMYWTQDDKLIRQLTIKGRYILRTSGADVVCKCVVDPRNRSKGWNGMGQPLLVTDSTYSAVKCQIAAITVPV